MLGASGGTSGHAFLASIVKTHRPDLTAYEEFYRNIHQFPEISGLERDTGLAVATHLHRLGFEVYANVGVHGVVGVFRNGPGKNVLIRAEMDALPIREQTGLSYQSNKTMIDRYGQSRPVMHACGHDMHMAALLAASDLLQAAKDKWSGTLLTLFQPDEEEMGGARAMVEDGLYEKVPVPDIMLAQHIVPRRAGKVAIQSGPVLTSADSMNVRIVGAPCHDSKNPNHCVDPIPLAMRIIMRLQDIVDEEFGKDNAITVACWGFHAGYPGNDFVAYADFLLDIKVFNPELRVQALDVIRTFITVESRKGRTPQDPIINTTVRAPLTSNDPSIVRPIRAVFNDYFLSDMEDMVLGIATEDFSLLGAQHNIPYAYWNIGGSPDAEGEIPENHSPFFALDVQPTLRAGTDAMALAVLKFLSEH